MIVSCVGLSAAEMKGLRTFRDDLSTFTRLLRGLGPLGDAFGRMTYEDSGARLVLERRGGAERAPGEARFGNGRGTTSLEGASNRNPRSWGGIQ
jgi:hypothetical protein